MKDSKTTRVRSCFLQEPQPEPASARFSPYLKKSSKAQPRPILAMIVIMGTFRKRGQLSFRRLNAIFYVREQSVQLRSNRQSRMPLPTPLLEILAHVLSLDASTPSLMHVDVDHWHDTLRLYVHRVVGISSSHRTFARLSFHPYEQIIRRLAKENQNFRLRYSRIMSCW